MKELVCPRCGCHMVCYPAISRRDGKTEICPDCGISEALFDFRKATYKTITKEDVELEKEWLKIPKHIITIENELS